MIIKLVFKYLLLPRFLRRISFWRRDQHLHGVHGRWLSGPRHQEEWQDTREISSQDYIRCFKVGFRMFYYLSFISHPCKPTFLRNSCQGSKRIRHWPINCTYPMIIHKITPWDYDYGMKCFDTPRPLNEPNN